MIEGDTRFTRLNMKLDRGSLAPGEYARGENVRVRRGVAETRKGTLPPPFANPTALSGGILGSGVYSNPNGATVLLVAQPSAVLLLRDGASATIVAIPEGTTLAAPIEFVQAFDKVLMFRGSNGTPLVWDGLSAAGFVPVVKSDDDPTYTAVIPNAETAESYRNRILVPFERDKVAVSDIGDYSIYDKDLEWHRINAGTADKLVRIFPFGDFVLMFKERSVLALSNFTGDPTAARLAPVNTSIGCAARRSVASVGGDVFFLSAPGGVYRVGQVMENQLQAAPVSVSDEIQPLIDRINWGAASGAVGIVYGENYFLAVPIDGSTTNNALLVYNTVTQGWESLDTWAGAINLSALHVYLYLGQPGLFAVDRTANTVYLLGTGKSDILAGGEVWPQMVFESRGYATLPEDSSGRKILANKNFRQLHLSVATWVPSFSVDAISDGVEELQPITNAPITRNRIKYLTFGRRDFNPDNSNGDFDLPYREDYSVDGNAGIYLGVAGIAPERKQEVVERFAFRALGRWTSFRVTNTQGSCDVLALGTESEPSQQNFRRAA